MRDNLKDKSYFDKFIETKTALINMNENSLLEGKVAESKIDRARFRNCGFRIETVLAKYSIGGDSINLSKSINEILNTISNEWTPIASKVKDSSGEFFNQYMVGPYERFLNLLSLAFLLEVTDDEFQVLVDIIDRDNISDNLYEFIIKARFPNREQKRPEEYDTKQSVILKVYDKLRKATETEDKVEASKLIKQFLEKDFYHKHMNLYNSHNSKADIYCGYWSFEAAAVVKIMGLDDSSFIDNQYYPKDLVHQTALTSKKKGLFGRLGF